MGSIIMIEHRWTKGVDDEENSEKRFSLWAVVVMLVVALHGIVFISYATVTFPTHFSCTQLAQVRSIKISVSGYVDVICKSTTTSSVLISLPTSTSETTWSDVISLNRYCAG